MKTVMLEDATWKTFKLLSVERGVPLQRLVDFALGFWVSKGAVYGTVVEGEVGGAGGAVAGAEVVGGPGSVQPAVRGEAGVVESLDVVGPSLSGGRGKATMAVRSGVPRGTSKGRRR